MKKKIMIGALAALFLSVGVFAVSNLQEKEQVSDLTLANIEAMTALGDEDDPVTAPCCTVIFNAACSYNAISPSGIQYVVTTSGLIIRCN